MKTFNLKANAIFMAEDIQNSFEKLSQHFKNMAYIANGGEEEVDEDLFCAGEISVKPITAKKCPIAEDGKHNFEKLSSCSVARCIRCGYSGPKQERELKEFLKKQIKE